MRVQKSELVGTRDTTVALTETLDREIGVVGQITDPVNIFFNENDIANADTVDFIYFNVYTLGRKKLVLWGVYDMELDEFHFDNACRYTTPQLMSIVNTWKKNNFMYSSNLVVNRIRERFAAYSRAHDEFPDIGTYATYRKLKLLVAYFESVSTPLSSRISSQLTHKDFEMLDYNFEHWLDTNYQFTYNPNSQMTIFDDFPVQFKVYLTHLKQRLTKYETKINRHDVEKTQDDLVHELTDKFYIFFMDSGYNYTDFVNSLSACPNRQDCQTGQTGQNDHCALYSYGSYPYIYRNDIERMRQTERGRLI